MRLWHESLISRLPRQQLLGQHREVCALRGNGWERRHRTVDYVFGYSPYKLYQYHELIMEEMKKRGYKPDAIWEDPLYRGKSCPAHVALSEVEWTEPVYKEHDDLYLEECFLNLEEKGIYLREK